MNKSKKSEFQPLKYLLFFGLLIVLSGVLSIPCAAQQSKPDMIEITIVSVKPEMVPQFEETLKKDYIPALAKGGVKWIDIWQPAGFGNMFDYVFVSPIDNFAQYDGEDPLVKALGKEGANAWYGKASKMVNSVKSAAYAVRDDLSYNTDMKTPPKMAVIAYTSVAPGRAMEFENFMKNEMLPVVKKSGIAGMWTQQLIFGGDGNEYLTVVLQENFADLDKGPPWTRALGPEGGMKLMQKLAPGVVTHQDRIVARFVPELSYRPEMKATK